MTEQPNKVVPNLINQLPKAKNLLNETQVLIKSNTGNTDQIVRISSRENNDSLIDIEYSDSEKPFLRY